MYVLTFGLAEIAKFRAVKTSSFLYYSDFEKTTEMTLNSKDIERETIVNCLSQQVNEYELLKSMYPNQGEIVLSDKCILDEINTFINAKTEYIPDHLDFKLNLNINGFKLELFINLPSSYPETEPDIYVRCNQLNRHNESRLNSELSFYLKENDTGEVCLYTAISWLQENIEGFTKITENQQNQNPKDDDGEIQADEDTLIRLWIYSHHIYNKKKRYEIVKRARDLNLTGFCLPGKPGIICIEGLNSDCNEWWKDIKAMNWKKIMIRKTETFEPAEQKNCKKFSNFEELLLKNQTNSKHANMSELSKYMNELGLSQVFTELFKLCNDD